MWSKWLEWYSTFNWWEKNFFTPLIIFVTIDVVVALVLMVISRADDIYHNKHTRPEEMFQMLLWPIGLIVGIPYALVEWPAQLLAKYRDHRRRKKLHINKAS